MGPKVKAHSESDLEAALRAGGPVCRESGRRERKPRGTEVSPVMETTGCPGSLVWLEDMKVWTAGR